MSDESTPQAPPPSEMELLRAEMRAGFQSIGMRLDGHDVRFESIDARFESIETRFGSIDTRFGSLETRIDTAAEDTRRHMDVRVEGLRADFQVVIDKTVATGTKVDRLIASNAIEHAAFQEFVSDHEVRIAQLEASSDPAPRPEDR